MKRLRDLSQEEYVSAIKSGMFWEWYPEATGIYAEDHWKKPPKRQTNYYKLNKLDSKIIIKREAHQEKYYYIQNVQDIKYFDVMYVGEWEMRPGVESNIEPSPQFIESFDDLFDAFDYIESLNGNSDLH